MRAERIGEHKEKLIVKSHLKNVEVPFLRIHGATAWGDPRSSDSDVKAHAMVVAGEMENGHFYVLSEFKGKMDELLRHAISTKDELLVEYVHCPPEPPGFLEQLHDEDGLTRYKVRSFNRWNKPVYEVSEPLKRWPSFRTWDTLCTVLEYEDLFLDDFESCRIIVERLTKAKQVEWSGYALPGLESSKSKSNAYELPIFRAWIYSVWYLWRSSEKRRSGRVEKGPERWPWGEEFINL